MLSRYIFFFNDTATTEIYTLSLHDALPIFDGRHARRGSGSEPRCTAARFGAYGPMSPRWRRLAVRGIQDRKSTRLNSSHANISYAVFCLKKKKKEHTSKLQSHQSLVCSLQL